MRLSDTLPERSRSLESVWDIRQSVKPLAVRVSYAKELMHGKKKTIYTVGKSKIFEGLGDSFQAARYHSLAAVREELPEVLKVTAEAEDGEVMAVEHTEYPVYGVQFHPESVMTPDGKLMIQNFMATVHR